jgi:hypothetical protein
MVRLLFFILDLFLTRYFILAILTFQACTYCDTGDDQSGVNNKYIIMIEAKSAVKRDGIGSRPSEWHNTIRDGTRGCKGGTTGCRKCGRDYTVYNLYWVSTEYNGSTQTTSQAALVGRFFILIAGPKDSLTWQASDCFFKLNTVLPAPHSRLFPLSNTFIMKYKILPLSVSIYYGLD